MLSNDKTAESIASILGDSSMPQIDVHATKPDNRKMFFHLHTLEFDLQPEVWRQHQSNGG